MTLPTHVCEPPGGVDGDCWCATWTDPLTPEELALDDDEQTADAGYAFSEDVRRELEAMQAVVGILNDLPMDTQRRVLVWAVARFRFTA